MQDHLKHELHGIISGKSQVRFGAIIQAAAGYLNNGSQAGSIAQGSKQIREEETKRLEDFISQNSLWVNNNVLYFIDTVFYTANEFWLKK